MIHIKSGMFKYGVGGEKLELPGFWIGKTPVTNVEYARFVNSTKYELPKHWNEKYPNDEILEHPVTCVSWYDAMAYAEWAGLRLPTEQEWEKAARGSGGEEYPWGKWERGRSNTKENGVGATTPVGQYSPDGDSPYGCVDMAGNVLEWTASVEEKYRILRGGAYNHNRELAHSTFRIRHKPSYQHKNIGFRVVSERSQNDSDSTA